MKNIYEFCLIIFTSIFLLNCSDDVNTFPQLNLQDELEVFVHEDSLLLEHAYKSVSFTIRNNSNYDVNYFDCVLEKYHSGVWITETAFDKNTNGLHIGKSSELEDSIRIKKDAQFRIGVVCGWSERINIVDTVYSQEFYLTLVKTKIPFRSLLFALYRSTPNEADVYVINNLDELFIAKNKFESHSDYFFDQFSNFNFNDSSIVGITTPIGASSSCYLHIDSIFCIQDTLGVYSHFYIPKIQFNDASSHTNLVAIEKKDFPAKLIELKYVHE